MDMKVNKNVLIGDVGGTNVRLQVFELKSDDLHYDSNKAIKSSIQHADKFGSFGEFVKEFLQDLDKAYYPDLAVIGIAGAIYENKTELANTKWIVVDGDEIGRQNGISPFILYNDFHTMSYGVLGLKDDQLSLLVKPKILHSDSLKVVCGPGTGLGIALLIPIGSSNFQVWPTEGGHCNFAPSNHLTYEYLDYLKNKLDTEQVHVEHATAGPSIPYIYNFLKMKNPDFPLSLELQHPSQIFDLINPKVFPNQLVMREGLEGEDMLCQATLEFFIHLYESSLGDIICRSLPFGGIYLFGGLSLMLQPYLERRVEEGKFMSQYKNNRPYFTHVFERVPIYIIQTKELGLEGAFQTAHKLLIRKINQV